LYIVTPRQMREIDSSAIKGLGIPSLVLMENAGVAVVDEIEKRIDSGRLKVTVMCGPGNNGGDGMVSARHLHDRGHEVVVYLAVPRAQFKGDANVQLKSVTRMGIPVSVLSSDSSFERAEQRIKDSHITIDAVFGTGLDRKIEGSFARCIQLVNTCPGLVVSADIPSGLDGSSGLPLGVAVTADITVTFGFPKTGIMLYPGAEYAGEVVIAEIGIPMSALQDVEVYGEIIDQESVKKAFPDRWVDTHKGTYGHLLVCSGSTGKMGAGLLTARAAMRAGAGLVTLALPASASQSVDPAALEIMTAPLPETADGSISFGGLKAIEKLLEGKSAIAIGPGLSMDEETVAFVREVLTWEGFAAVVDADALNAIGTDLHILQVRGDHTVLTPHPGEMARLLGTGIMDVQADRIGSSLMCAEQSGCTVVLKGARTIVARPDGAFFINTTGNPGMATGGTGDVLTGILGALLASGRSAITSALASVYLHGAAGDRAAEQITEHSLIASDVIDNMGVSLKEILAE